MRYTYIALSLLIFLFVCFKPDTREAAGQPKPPFSYEIWITNQTDDSIHVFHGRTLKRIAVIPVDEDGQPATSKPHTIAFSPDGQYAYVANVGAKTNTNNVTVIRSSDRKIIATIPAGPGAHMVMPSPNGSHVFVANAGSDSVMEILADTSKESFTPGRMLKIKGNNGKKSHPTCLAFSPNGEKLYITNAGRSKLDPSTSGFLTIFEVQSGREQSRINNLGNEACGLAHTQDGGKIYFTMGGTVHKFAILNTETDKILEQISTGGQDPHGLAITPGGHQVWITNRVSGNITVLNPTTGMHITTHFKVGHMPDLLDFSPDGSKVFITLRGKPVTPLPKRITGTEPGFIMMEVDTGKVLSRVPMQGDPHGIAIRSIK